MNIFKLLLLILLTGLLSACVPESPKMQDGYYTAELADFNEYGWKEYLTIYVSDNKILTVEYDAYNISGFVRSWDLNYMRNMLATGTYPNEFTRTYAISLINSQNPDDVDVVSGATHSHTTFQMLSKAAIAQALAGDKCVAKIVYDNTTATKDFSGGNLTANG